MDGWIDGHRDSANAVTEARSFVDWSLVVRAFGVTAERVDMPVCVSKGKVLKSNSSSYIRLLSLSLKSYIRSRVSIFVL
jgi:hypothetical protein